MTDLETAILDILCRARPNALTLSDIHVRLVELRWDVRMILPRHITDACIVLDEAGLVRNELAWHALSNAVAWERDASPGHASDAASAAHESPTLASRPGDASEMKP